MSDTYIGYAATSSDEDEQWELQVAYPPLRSRHREIKYKKTQSQHNLYQECPHTSASTCIAFQHYERRRTTASCTYA
eukprot:3513880-Rhodomonas_salina.4